MRNEERAMSSEQWRSTDRRPPTADRGTRNTKHGTRNTLHAIGQEAHPRKGQRHHSAQFGQGGQPAQQAQNQRAPPGEAALQEVHRQRYRHHRQAVHQVVVVDDAPHEDELGVEGHQRRCQRCSLFRLGKGQAGRRVDGHHRHAPQRSRKQPHHVDRPRCSLVRELLPTRIVPVPGHVVAGRPATGRERVTGRQPLQVVEGQAQHAHQRRVERIVQRGLGALLPEPVADGVLAALHRNAPPLCDVLGVKHVADLVRPLVDRRHQPIDQGHRDVQR